MKTKHYDRTEIENFIRVNRYILRGYVPVTAGTYEGIKECLINSYASGFVYIPPQTMFFKMPPVPDDVRELLDKLFTGKINIYDKKYFIIPTPQGVRVAQDKMYK